MKNQGFRRFCVHYTTLCAKYQQFSAEKHCDFSICRLFVANLPFYALFFRNPFSLSTAVQIST